MVKNLPAMQGSRFDPRSGRSPGEGNGNLLQHSCLENPWTEEPGRSQSMGSQRVGHDWTTNTFTFTHLYSVLFSSPVPHISVSFPRYMPYFSNENSIPFFLSVLFIFTFLRLTAWCFENAKYSANAYWIKFTHGKYVLMQVYIYIYTHTHTYIYIAAYIFTYR